jgi:hypothetical protein
VSDDRSEWSDRRLDREFDAFRDAIKGVADLPLITARLDQLCRELAELRKSVEAGAARRAQIVVAVIAAFAAIAAACISAAVVLLQHHP